jgi:hypothetical protein
VVKSSPAPMFRISRFGKSFLKNDTPPPPCLHSAKLAGTLRMNHGEGRALERSSVRMVTRLKRRSNGTRPLKLREDGDQSHGFP